MCGYLQVEWLRQDECIGGQDNLTDSQQNYILGNSLIVPLP